MSEDRYFENNDFLEECSFDDMYKGEEFSTDIFNSVEDPEKERLIDKILEWDKWLSTLQKRTGFKARYKIFDYQSRNLYRLDNEVLEKILRNIINQIYDILWQMGYDPHAYSKYRSKKYKLEPGFSKYWISKIAPSHLGQTLFPPFLSEVSLDELDWELLSFIKMNLSSLCQVELSKLEWSIENGKVKESDVINTIRKDLLQRPNVDPQLRKEVEDEIIRYELSHKPEKQRLELRRLYEQFYKAMAQRESTENKQQAQILSDGLRRRKELEELKQGKTIKRKETLGASAAEEICKRLSSESRRKRSES